MKLLLKSMYLVLMLIGVALEMGCATADAENKAERPWNAPKSWENGMPPGMMEGR